MRYEIHHGAEANRRAYTELEPGHQGTTTDGQEQFYGHASTPIGRAVVPPLLPRGAMDVRRLWTVASQGQESFVTDVLGNTVDTSGVSISPRGTPTTDAVAMGYIGQNELSDGGEVVITAMGTYKPGSLLPRFLARLKIGSSYVAPQYEATNPNASNVADTFGTQANAFEWSSITCGLNALGGYEALWLPATNLNKGEFQWRLTLRIHALGRMAKWQRGDDAHAASDDATCWVESTLEWGALQANAGGRIGESFGLYNPLSAQTMQYNAFLPSGVKRGYFYTFGGQQWLCHADSTSTAVAGAGPARTLTHNNWTQMLAEEAPGIGLHWREFFVPLVSRSTVSAFGVVDWSVGNEIALELGGPVQQDHGTAWGTYGATTGYVAESVGVIDTGTVYAPKTTMYVASFPRMVNGSEVSLFTAGVANRRCWRPLPPSLRDTMRMQQTHAYLYGRRNGVTGKRIG